MKVVDEAKCVYAFTEMWSNFDFDGQKDYCKEIIPKGGCEKCDGEMLTYHTEVKVKTTADHFSAETEFNFFYRTEQNNSR